MKKLESKRVKPSLFWGMLLTSFLAAVGSCNVDSSREQPKSEPGIGAPEESSPMHLIGTSSRKRAGDLGSAKGARGQKSTALSPAMRVALLKTRQAEATTEYAIAPSVANDKSFRDPPILRDGSTLRFRAVNPARQLIAEFTDRGLIAALKSAPASGGKGRVGFRLQRWGRDGKSGQLADTKPLGSPTLAQSEILDDQGQPAGMLKNRVEYRHSGGLTEWYLNGPHGLEQGFTLAERPAGSGGLLLDVAIDGEGITPTLSGNVVELHTSPEVIVGEYRDLFAEDAKGKLIPARLSVVDGMARISVDDSDAEYPLVVDPTIWLVEAKLVAMVPNEGGLDGEEGDAFGQAVAIDGNTMAVGAPSAEGGVANSGVVYVYVLEGMTWRIQQKLAASDGVTDQEFGFSLSLSGDDLIVGSNSGKGAAYVYHRRVGIWRMQQKLVDPEGEEDDAFGFSVSLFGETLAIGARDDDDGQGLVHVYTRSGTTWSLEERLAAADGAADDRFGCSVSLNENTLAIGALGDDSATGSVYVYVRGELGAWNQEQKLAAADGIENDVFGARVALSGGTLAISAVGEGEYRGSAYVFVRSGSNWTLQQKLVAGDGVEGDYFGYSLSVSGDSLAIGAVLYNGDEGAAYVFVRSGGSWTREQRFTV